MSLERDIGNLVEDLDPKFLYSLGHKSDNMLLVWWYNSTTGEFLSSTKPGSTHSQAKLFGNSDIYGKPGWVRGRVFTYGGKNILIMYFVSMLRLPATTMVDILDKVVNTLGNIHINYIVDEAGKDISGLFEANHIASYGVSKLSGG